jgi:hypothetical protein
MIRSEASEPRQSDQPRKHPNTMTHTQTPPDPTNGRTAGILTRDEWLCKQAIEYGEMPPCLILGIDPGTTHSGFCLWNGDRVIDKGWMENEVLRANLTDGELLFGRPLVAIEMIASQGMAVGKETFETVYWIGRFAERCINRTDVTRITRHEIKIHICGSARAKDPNIRQALIDRLGPVGTKKAPGPLYGVSGHVWPALAVAIVAQDRMEGK